ncbi:MAG TPA: NUDIX hydrolase [Myxococcota bacterium]|nr:NUDIX hydrolase [Myxococcota bacterium]
MRMLRAVEDRLRKNTKGKVIRAAGALLWKRGPEGRRLALIRRSTHGDTWSLPKGKLKRGESWLQGAVREVEEETACRGKVVGVAGTVAYLVKGVPKVVVFLEMKVRREAEFVPSEEIDELRWCSPRQARRMLAHPEERKLVPAR